MASFGTYRYVLYVRTYGCATYRYYDHVASELLYVCTGTGVTVHVLGVTIAMCTARTTYWYGSNVSAVQYCYIHRCNVRYVRTLLYTSRVRVDVKLESKGPK